MKFSKKLVAMLFVAVAAAVPTEMLKREPGSSLESEARGIVHCNAICVPVDCNLLCVDSRNSESEPQRRREEAAAFDTLEDPD
ncbi:hypothetical protein DFH09DRAFT_1287094 [Mycena vulgaris]|nr:hypothetical protein DFH09DRAFT_1287094 [Mycena vulgaris]